MAIRISSLNPTVVNILLDVAFMAVSLALVWAFHCLTTWAATRRILAGKGVRLEAVTGELGRSRLQALLQQPGLRVTLLFLVLVAAVHPLADAGLKFVAIPTGEVVNVLGIGLGQDTVWWSPSSGLEQGGGQYDNRQGIDENVHKVMQAYRKKFVAGTAFDKDCVIPEPEYEKTTIGADKLCIPYHDTIAREFGPNVTVPSQTFDQDFALPPSRVPSTTYPFNYTNDLGITVPAVPSNDTLYSSFCHELPQCVDRVGRGHCI